MSSGEVLILNFTGLPFERYLLNGLEDHFADIFKLNNKQKKAITVYNKNLISSSELLISDEYLTGKVYNINNIKQLDPDIIKQNEAGIIILYLKDKNKIINEIQKLNNTIIIFSYHMYTLYQDTVSFIILLFNLYNLENNNKTLRYYY